VGLPFSFLRFVKTKFVTICSNPLFEYGPLNRRDRAPNMIQEDKDDQNTVPSSISNTGPLAQDIREEDRKFVSFSTRGRVLDYDFIAWFT
jgi:hypothetical protein